VRFTPLTAEAAREQWRGQRALLDRAAAALCADAVWVRLADRAVA
jgi:hypothetical protein